ncbi:MAG TPA: GDYXXLXY domain-containing protein [Pseudobacteroides sp.]|uniref:GDYXXLXY domain-containing protein n=1 Tax=Pseudobacteroides sp. TaxID=1968840 RepID=UPI002F9550FF
MKKHIKIILFIILSLAQLAFPAQMIMSRENVLNKGQVFKFRIKPIDPVDNFRGNYLSIYFSDNRVPVSSNDNYSLNQTVYATVENDIDGFAKFTGVSSQIPEHRNYIKTKILYFDYETRAGEESKTTKLVPRAVYIKIPFERYYMAENKAKPAEEAYNKSLSERKEVYITVKIHNGDTVVENLYIDGEKIEDYLRHD